VAAALGGPLSDVPPKNVLTAWFEFNLIRISWTKHIAPPGEETKPRCTLRGPNVVEKQQLD
jgi:hypothetical protein